MFMSDTALSIYVTQIPIALAIFFASLLILNVKNVLVSILKTQIEINKQNKNMLERILKLEEKRK